MPKPTHTRSRIVTNRDIGDTYLWYIDDTGRYLMNYWPGGTVHGTQTTVSEGHHWPRPKGEFSDQGGEFFTTKSEIINEGFPQVAFQNPENSPSFYLLTGKMAVYLPWQNPTTQTELQFPPRNLSSRDDLYEKGATAISRCTPTNSPADLATFLGELIKEGIPSAIGNSWKNSTDRARKRAADEYLNIQFGWVPIYNEMRKFADTVKHANSVLEQFERDSGKMVRRKYRFPSEKQVETYPVGFKTPVLGKVASSMMSHLARDVILTRETVREISFSGGFTYYLPSGYDSRNGLVRAATRADQLFGLNITPEVIWNLAPWSWAIDWFGNVGDVLKNVSNFSQNGLILRYGYITEAVTVTDTYSQSTTSNNAGTETAAPLVLRTKSIQRLRANPYGFGVSWDGLSPFQLSILAALGISKRG